jgi:hypothetical protein
MEQTVNKSNKRKLKRINPPTLEFCAALFMVLELKIVISSSSRRRKKAKGFVHRN